jgi:hypothetical protein
LNILSVFEAAWSQPSHSRCILCNTYDALAKKTLLILIRREVDFNVMVPFFPMGASSPAKHTHTDSYKKTYKRPQKKTGVPAINIQSITECEALQGEWGKSTKI